MPGRSRARTQHLIGVIPDSAPHTLPRSKAMRQLVDARKSTGRLPSRGVSFQRVMCGDILRSLPTLTTNTEPPHPVPRPGSRVVRGCSPPRAAVPVGSPSGDCGGPRVGNPPRKTSRRSRRMRSTRYRRTTYSFRSVCSSTLFGSGTRSAVGASAVTSSTPWVTPSAEDKTNRAAPPRTRGPQLKPQGPGGAGFNVDTSRWYQQPDRRSLLAGIPET